MPLLPLLRHGQHAEPFALTQLEASPPTKLEPTTSVCVRPGMANTLLLPDTREELEPSGEDFPLARHFDAASGKLDAPGGPS